MQKKISTGVWIAVVAMIIIVLAIWIALALPAQPPTKTGITIPNTPVNPGENGEKACLDSGGTASTASCCGQTQDFPNNCAIGSCGCSPTNSHQVKTCECGAGKCFNGNLCVTVLQQPQPM